MSSKPKRPSEPASDVVPGTETSVATPPPPPVGSHRYHFLGHASYVATAMERSNLPARYLNRVLASVPIGHLARVLAGLAEMSIRTRGRNLWPTEMATVQTTLLGLEETRWYFRAAAGASFAMIADTVQALAPDGPDGTLRLIPSDGPDELPEPIPPARRNFAGVGPYFEAQSASLGLLPKFTKRAQQCPEAHRIATRCGELFGRFPATPSGDSPPLSVADRAIVHGALGNVAEEAQVLFALAEAAEAMLLDAYVGFGLAMPEMPPAEMPDCKGVNPILTSTKRTRARPAAFYVG